MAGAVDDDTVGQSAYSWAIAEKLSYWCASYSGGTCHQGASDNSMLNYLATRASAMMAYDKYVTYKQPFSPVRGGRIINHTLNEYGTYNWDFKIAKGVVMNALNSLTPHGSLADFGNDTMFPESCRNLMRSASFGNNSDEVVWSSADSRAYVLTEAQIRYWLNIK